MFSVQKTGLQVPVGCLVDAFNYHLISTWPCFQQTLCIPGWADVEKIVELVLGSSSLLAALFLPVNTTLIITHAFNESERPWEKQYSLEPAAWAFETGWLGWRSSILTGYVTPRKLFQPLEAQIFSSVKWRFQYLLCRVAMRIWWSNTGKVLNAYNSWHWVGNSMYVSYYKYYLINQEPLKN